MRVHGGCELTRLSSGVVAKCDSDGKPEAKRADVPDRTMACDGKPEARWADGSRQDYGLQSVSLPRSGGLWVL